MAQPIQLAETHTAAPTPSGGYPSLETVLEWYRTEAGWDPANEFPFAQVFGLMRNGVISQGIAARIARGQASSAEALRYGSKMFPLGELAWHTVQQYESQRNKAKL